MKRNQNVIVGIAAVLSAAAIGTAFAQSGGMGSSRMSGSAASMESGSMMGGGMMGEGDMRQRGMAEGMMHAGDSAAMVDRRLADTKAALHITAAQEPAWQAFATQAKQQAGAMQTMRGKLQGADANATAPDRMQARTQLLQQRLSGMEAMTKALKHLYTALSPEQRSIVNQRLSMMGEQRMGMSAHAE
ncbi:MAG: Spy/CpxP family protein refolding chaperone [Betaproteobacteria bacterium]|nr:Spy/CpxP family protein refolding chaperone [Betaproteobacteria bacterium]MDE2124877.1 Spy/CpxP family protein refolding chaperone [Betaproteobacteria bacterium]MDE2186511.1 Spy/CpxP family protein refolding chaperone [Betaproteobacteria bacterium]MDE2325350.1 Spy/CpxP family protein refolding chaperone [Betaproteobacteria bacterium]